MFARLAAALALGLFAVSVTAPALAHEYKLGTLSIDHPWARASAGNAPNGAAFMTITNGGSTPDRLVSVASPVADKVELHTHMMDADGVMKMRPVEAIELAPGAQTSLAPGGLHVMLMGLHAPLIEGARFPATLVFEQAGEIAVEIAVEGVAAMGGSADGAAHDATGHGMDTDMDMDGDDGN